MSKINLPIFTAEGKDAGETFLDADTIKNMHIRDYMVGGRPVEGKSVLYEGVGGKSDGVIFISMDKERLIAYLGKHIPEFKSTTSGDWYQHS